jgi:hypothetical protein
MKKILTTLSLFLALFAAAQEKYAPTIRQGTKLTYQIFANGQTISSNFSFDSIATDYMRFGWSIDQLGTGSWIMKSKSINSATRGYWDQPSPGVQQELPGDQTVILFSKAQWASLQKDKKITADGQTFVLKEPTEQQQLKLAGKTVDALLLENQRGNSRIWVLNNPEFPILLKIEGNTLGVDLTVASIE